MIIFLIYPMIRQHVANKENSSNLKFENKVTNIMFLVLNYQHANHIVSSIYHSATVMYLISLKLNLTSKV